MARIVYAVADEGKGHATRSRVLIQALQKEHEVLVLTGRRCFAYLSRFAKTESIAGAYIFYERNRVSNLGTSVWNFFRFPRYIADFFRARKLLKDFSPDIVITDFEAISTYAALSLRIPVISVGNHHIITKTAIAFPKKFFFNYLKTSAIIRLVIPTAHYYVITSFFSPPVSSSKVFLVPPVLRGEITHGQTAYTNFVLVYQTSQSNKKLFRILSKLPYHFVAYGMSPVGFAENITFKPFDEKHFFDDLKNCAGIIANGGFTLMTEALYLNKPLLSIPIAGQFEQVINAFYLNATGKGSFLLKNNQKKIVRFIESLQFNSSQKQAKIYEGNHKAIGVLQGLITNITKEQLLDKIPQ
jgi:uncharacterized protein (TIGR00661 family)